MPRHLLTLVVLCLFLFGQFVKCIDDPYKVLGVSKSASVDEIKKAYKNLAKKWHPDKNENSQEAADKYVELTTAYEILTDDEKKRQFEQSKHGNRYDGFGFSYFFQNTKPIFSETFSITYENYDAFVGSSEDIWVIEFYTDRCGPCIENAPIWEQTAKSLSDFVHFGRINADEQGSLLRHFRIRSIPAVIAVLSNGNTHPFYGRFDLHGLSDFIKKLMPSQITGLINNNDWEKFQSTNNNKPKALLFSSHSSTISPLYKYVSVKYSHLFNFAQVTGEKLDSSLVSRYGIKTRPTIVFFAENSASSRVVPGSFTKESLIKILEQNKFMGAPELHNDNFLHLCGRKSTELCGITFTTPSSKYFTKHLQFLRQLPNSENEVKVGWVDAAKVPHFLSFFNISFRDAENLHSMLIWDGSKRKYTLINQEIKSNTVSDWTSTRGSAKFMDIPRDVPSLVEPSPESLFSFSWLVVIIRFIGNNLISVLVIGLVLFRMISKR